MDSDELDPNYALETIAKFVPEWGHLTPLDITATRIKSGLVNRLYRVECNLGDVTPKNVLFRLFGGNLIKLDKPEFTIEETITSYEQSRNGQGPHLYGVFPGGRIEEFIPSHNLTAQEAMDPSIRRDIAKAYARFHSIEFPFDRTKSSKKFEVPDFTDDHFEAFSHEKIAHLSLKDKLKNIEYKAGAEWLNMAFEKSNPRMVFCLADNNFANVLVREGHVPENKLKVVLIDYELVTVAPRGIDIGGHFIQRLFDATKADMASGYDYPSREERIQFCQEYLEEWKRLNPNKFDDNLDTINHLMMEADVAACFGAFYAMQGAIRDFKNWLEAPSLFTCLPPISDFYRRQKQYIEEVYKV